MDIIGDFEEPDDVPLTFLSTLNQWCKLKNKREWINQVIQEQIGAQIYF